ncbi:MAG TPA: PilZ domain-containing protein [bacterium]
MGQARMQERRRIIRIGTPILIEFDDPATGDTERSFTQDVSEEGMRFPSGVQFRAAQRVEFTLALPASNMTMRTVGEVQWVREIARHGGPQYEIGVRFTWEDEQARDRLTGHLLGFLQPRK